MNNISMVLEIIISKFTCIFKTMSRNNFPEPQPDSASSREDTKKIQIRALPKLAEPHPPSILGCCGALLRVNRNILQNMTKQRKLSYCWPLKLNEAFDHCSSLQHF